MCFQFVNIVRSAIEANTLSVKLNYRSCSIIGLVVHRVCYSWTELMQQGGNEALGAKLIHYM